MTTSSGNLRSIIRGIGQSNGDLISSIRAFEQSNLDLISGIIPRKDTILIDNFSMLVEDWEYIPELLNFSVDVVDRYFSIDTSNTYFLQDGTIMPTTFSGITDGYRMFYVPTDLSSSGTITIIAHAENDGGGYVDKYFYFLYGYHVHYNAEGIDWGPAKTVVTVAKASNTAFCENTVGESVYFETKDFPSYDLRASIYAIPSVDLGATIYPQSDFFFYGRTYTITLKGIKDYSGNKMEPFNFTFTIENPNN